MPGPNQNYPDDCIQALVTEGWWTEDQQPTFRPGRLVWGFATYFNASPFELEPIGRQDPTDHEKADYVLRRFDIKVPPTVKGNLPVAALPLSRSERLVVARGKIRPILLVSTPTTYPKRARGAPQWQTAPYLLGVPLYGVDTPGSAGWREDFVTRIRHCMYAQYFWDISPLGGQESILRFDQVFPVPMNFKAVEMTPYRLSDEALGVLLEWLLWILTGHIEENGYIALVQQEFLQNRPSS